MQTVTVQVNSARLGNTDSAMEENGAGQGLATVELELLDFGTGLVALRPVDREQFLSAEADEGGAVRADGHGVGYQELFTAETDGSGGLSLRTLDGRALSLDAEGALVATAPGVATATALFTTVTAPGPRPHPHALCHFRDSSGHYVATASPDSVLRMGRQSPGMFALYPMRDQNRFVLLCLATNRYVNGRDVLRAKAHHHGPDETFTLHDRGDGKVVLEAITGFVASKDDVLVSDRSRIEDADVFEFRRDEQSAEAIKAWKDCCGLHRDEGDDDGEGQPAPVWDDETHQRLLTAAFGLLSPRRGSHPDLERLFILWDQKPFMEAVKQGLHDADYKVPWNNALFDGPYGLYFSHFYDPDTGTNYLGMTSPTALTMGRALLEASAFTGLRLATRLQANEPVSPEELRKAGYHLGLGLHYLTDLTQPMHASNFANVFTPVAPFIHFNDWRHSGFEGYAEKKIKAGYLDHLEPLKPHELDISRFDGMEDVLKATARTAKDIFSSELLSEANKKITWVNGPPWPVRSIDSSWGKEADASLEKALKGAPRQAARCLYYWTRLPQSLDLFRPHGMRQGHKGFWVFPSGWDWFPGHKNPVTVVTSQGNNWYSIEGECKFNWRLDPHQGYIGIHLTNFSHADACVFTLDDRGTMFGTEDFMKRWKLPKDTVRRRVFQMRCKVDLERRKIVMTTNTMQYWFKKPGQTEFEQGPTGTMPNMAEISTEVPLDRRWHPFIEFNIQIRDPGNENSNIFRFEITDLPKP